MKIINGKYNLKRKLNYNEWMLYIYKYLIIDRNSNIDKNDLL